jgi:tetratricopeptide (TPR) repeat protein
LEAFHQRPNFSIRGLTPIVGRGRELELLLDGLERCKAGRGQAISIISDAGVGKSRLLYEFRKAVTSEDVTFLEGKCLSYSRGVVYHPIIDILKSNFDIRDDDKDLQIREKIKRGLKILGADEGSILPYLLEVLSVKNYDIDKIPLSPEERKDRILGALKQIVLKGSEIRPLIMAYENLHWIDKSSEESLKKLLDAISAARVLLIFTYRPEFVHTWAGRSYHSQVNLNRLSTRETLMMVSHLLSTEDFDKEIEQLVLEKTEGVPFFIEELINSLRDQKIIEKKDNKYHLTKDIREAIIPSTIHDVIMARVDTLPEKAKTLLQTGSVAGREFSLHLIKKVTEFSKDDLLSHLSVLKDSELLYERGIYPQSNYLFKHALTQEVAYNSLLQKRRTELHEKIGNVFTLTFVYNFLAMAYLRLGKLEPALPLLEKGHELCRFSEVQSMYSYTVGSLGYAYLLAKEPKRALALLEKGAKDENLQASFWPAHPLTVLADAYRAAGDIASATETVSRALKLSDKRDERGFEAWAMLVMAGINDAAERLEEAKQWYQRALKQASNLSMRPLVAHCHKGLANSYFRLGKKKEAQLENKTALEMYRSLGMTYWLNL